VRTRRRQGNWAEATTAAALLALWLVVPGCRRVEAPKDEKSASRSNQAIAVPTIGPTTMGPMVRPRLPARPTSGRAKVLTKKKAVFKLFKSKTDPPTPVTGCPKCGTKVPGRGVISGEGKLLGYTIREHRGPSGLPTFSILKGGKRLFDCNVEGQFDYGSTWETAGNTDADLKRLLGISKSKLKDEGDDPERLRRSKLAQRWLTPGADVTGVGKPNLVVRVHEGLGHCCTSLLIFALSPRIRKVQSVWLGHNAGFDEHFYDLDKDGFPEIELRDWTFAYWKASFNDSPAPRVVLKFQKGRYRIATSLMQKPPLSLRDLRKQARSLQYPKAFSADFAPFTLWATMLQLAYTGHAQLARKFFNLTWPKGVKGKRKFLATFRKKLRTSPYWSAVRKMDGPI